MVKKNSKIIFIVLILILSCMTVGCGKEEKNLQNEKEQSDEKIYEVGTVENTDDESIGTKNEEEKEEEKFMYTSLLNGMKYEEDITSRRPIVVMLDNHYGARPQAGLSSADIVYEILVEGKITRYAAVFQSRIPDNIGPIRSARPYFILRAMEYDSIYVHVGGSEQAKKDIKNYNLAEVDGLSSGRDVFWRKKHKNMPHNMYSSSDAIYKEASRKKYRENFDMKTLKFNEKKENIGTEDCSYVKITYKNPTSSDKIGYYVEFKYDDDQEKYFRYVNGKEHIEESDKSPLYAENIIVQIAKHKTIDNEGRRDISFIGEGKGYYISNGKRAEVTWKKADKSSITKYYNLKNEEISLNPGVIWIQVISDENGLEW